MSVIPPSQIMFSFESQDLYEQLSASFFSITLDFMDMSNLSQRRLTYSLVYMFFRRTHRHVSESTLYHTQNITAHCKVLSTWGIVFPTGPLIQCSLGFRQITNVVALRRIPMTLITRLPTLDQQIQAELQGNPTNRVVVTNTAATKRARVNLVREINFHHSPPKTGIDVHTFSDHLDLYSLRHHHHPQKALHLRSKIPPLLSPAISV